MPKIMEIIEKETKGKSYHTYKYSYDTIGLPSIDYDDDPNKVMKWKDSGETGSPKKPIDLKPLADQLQSVGEKPLLKYFLDGSRHVFKVDDIAYNKQVFPVVAGQIGIGCCKRENKRMSKERFYRELVLALPDKAYVFFYAIFNLRNLLYIILFSAYISIISQNFTNCVCVFALPNEIVFLLQKILDYKVFLIGCEIEIKLFHTKITSAFTTSVTLLRILFILRTHAIWSAALSCSVTPSISPSSFTSRRKSCCACSSMSARWEWSLPEVSRL